MPLIRNLFMQSIENQYNVDGSTNLLGPDAGAYFYSTVTTQQAYVEGIFTLPMPSGAIVRKAFINFDYNEVISGTGEDISVTTILRYSPGLSPFTVVSTAQQGIVSDSSGNLTIGFPLESSNLSRRHLLTQHPQAISLFFSLGVADSSDSFEGRVLNLKFNAEYSMTDFASAPPFIDEIEEEFYLRKIFNIRNVKRTNVYAPKRATFQSKSRSPR